MIDLILTASMALHPLGNFSVNQLVSLSLHPDRVEAVAIVDLAELPSLQLTPDCGSVAQNLTVKVGSDRLKWTIGETNLRKEPGAAGLETTRLTCHLSSPAKLDHGTDLEVTNTYLPDRVGWHELTATGHGVQVTGLPAASVTDQLRSYPVDLLSSPPDVRSAKLSAVPGSTSDSAAVPLAPASSNIVARAEQWLQNAVGDRGLTPLVGLLAVLLAMILGAGHAMLPGHGKTVMAIYLAGRAGRPRDAVAVGATVTATHTGGVLILGLLLTGFASLAGETILGWAGIISGSLVMLVGGSMLYATLRHRRRGQSVWSAVFHGHSHGLGIHRHGHDHPHAHDHDHSHRGHGHPHGPDHDHSHGGHSNPHGTGHDDLHAHDHPHGTSHDQAHEHDPNHVAGHGHNHPHGLGDPHGPDHGRIRSLVRETGQANETGSTHAHGHGTGHVHDSERSHSHGNQKQRRAHRASLTALGIAGGLVPSPSALIVLLGAIALGRTGFGVLLVLAYGVGMAGTLTLAGLTLLKVRDRLRGRWQKLARLAPATPYATGGLVLIVGIGLAARAAAMVV